MNDDMEHKQTGMGKNNNEGRMQRNKRYREKRIKKC
jgi:hypothetical protein